MPELPEVECVARGMAHCLTGRYIKSVHLLNRATCQGSPQAPSVLIGKRIEQVSRRGKFLLLDLSPSLRVAIHLRMTGWLGVRGRAHWQDPHIRLLAPLETEAGRPEEALLFRDIRKFGRIWCGTPQELDGLKSLQRLGPDALLISPEEFTSRLRARRGRLKSLLLDQHFLAGLGNIYADEALYAARLHPLKNPQKLTLQEIVTLHRSIQKILQRALAAGGSSIDDYRHPDGSQGWFQRVLKAYGRTGKPCPRCGAAIQRIVLGQRGSWFCPCCQVAPRRG